MSQLEHMHPIRRMLIRVLGMRTPEIMRVDVAIPRYQRERTTSWGDDKWKNTTTLIHGRVDCILETLY